MNLSRDTWRQVYREINILEEILNVQKNTENIRRKQKHSDSFLFIRPLNINTLKVF